MDALQNLNEIRSDKYDTCLRIIYDMNELLRFKAWIKMGEYISSFRGCSEDLRIFKAVPGQNSDDLSLLDF